MTQPPVPLAPAAPPTADQFAVLDAWLPGRRWYPLKGTAVTHRPVASFAAGPVVFHLLRATGGGRDVIIHVPVVLTAPTDGPGPGYLGEADGFLLHDGAAHPQCWDTILRASAWAPHAPVVAATGGRALAVEQSNSSVALPSGPAMMKIMRTIAPGPNPDVTVPRALIGVGWNGVPRPYAWLEVPLSASITHLAVISEFIDDAQDGFDVACEGAAHGVPFTEAAASLGSTIAEMHSALGRALPHGAPIAADWLLGDLRRRAGEAMSNVPALAERAPAITAFLDRTAQTLGSGSPTQAIHGDLHLGQVLVAGPRWVVLDFEGEPMRPLAERTRPDLPLRDVAGMLRSFDYAAAIGGHKQAAMATGGQPEPHGPRARTTSWAAAAKAAFWTQYAHQAGHDPDEHRATLNALVLDKALYEAVYEQHNRPAWLPIPLAAVDELTRTDD